ncbi:hypothetical protein BH11PSE4_BH11PSE4_24420 [soil metagenome]
MARTTQWDEAFLRQRANAADEAALAQLRDQDRMRAAAQLKREISDSCCGFFRCPDSRCRRARRCVEEAQLACYDRLGAELPDDVEQSLLDEIYAEIQEERRDAAARDEDEDEESEA